MRRRERRCERLGSCPGGSWSVSGALWGCFWTTPDRSWPAQRAPRSALGRHLGVEKPSQARPDASLKRSWAPELAQRRFFVNLESIREGFFSIFDLFFVDFRSCRVRRRHESRFSKKNDVQRDRNIDPSETIQNLCECNKIHGHRNVRFH